jgi:hypothetical protein
MPSAHFIRSNTWMPSVAVWSGATTTTMTEPMAAQAVTSSATFRISSGGNPAQWRSSDRVRRAATTPSQSLSIAGDSRDPPPPLFPPPPLPAAVAAPDPAPPHDPPPSDPPPPEEAATAPAEAMPAADPPTPSEEPPPSPPTNSVQNKIELVIDSLPHHPIVIPIPVVIEALGDKVFVADIHDLNMTMAGTSVAEVLFHLKDHIESIYEDYRSRKSLDREQKRQFDLLNMHMGNDFRKRDWYMK